MSVLRTNGNYRAFTGSDNAFIAWLRDEAGPLDLTAYTTLAVQVRRGSDLPLLTVTPTGDALGQLDFTLTAENIAGALSALGVFRLYVLADGAVIHTGTLEVLE